MSQTATLRGSTGTSERTSIHDMLKEASAGPNHHYSHHAATVNVNAVVGGDGKASSTTSPVTPAGSSSAAAMVAARGDHILGGSTPYSRSVPANLSAAAGAASPAILKPSSASTTALSTAAGGSSAAGGGGRGNGQESNGDSTAVMKAASRIENLKNWSISAYKCTKQLMFEKLGKSSRTVDEELEGQIELLRDTQRKYLAVLRLARTLTSHFYHVVQTQHALGEAFADLAQKSPELQEEFLYNAETQRNLTRNGDTLLGALNFFTSSVNTLCNKTIEDTLQSVRQYEAARVEYDAYRTDLEAMSAKPDGAMGLEDAQAGFELHRQQFLKLRAEVGIKIKFLDENRIKVMHKQLLLFHNAVSAYFSGNQSALEATLKQFNIKVKTPNSTFPSWLEQ